MVKLKNWFASPTFADEEKTRQAHLLNIILFTIIGLVGLLTIIRIIDGDSMFFEVTVVTSIVVLSSLILQFALRKGHVKTVSILTVSISWLALTYLSWSADGIKDTAFVGYIAVILLTNLLLGWQAGIAMTGLSIAAGWIFALAEENGLIIPVYDAPFNIALDLTVIFGISAVILVLTTADLSTALQRVRASERSLAQSNQELEAVRSMLENRVAERTRNLELVANLSSHLVSILDINQLMTELVTQTKKAFNFYHVHIYRLDPQSNTLIVTEGTGQAGAEMKAKGHSINLDAATSLVARAARTQQIVRVDNVRIASDWLPNPLLPDTYSEMAVPIVVDDAVVGVLDVQQDKIAGFDEGHENFLRSLASQVAIAIRNARLFSEVEQALEQAHQAHTRYTEQTWARARQNMRQVFLQPGAPTPPEEIRAKLKQLALTQQNIIPLTLADNAQTGSDSIPTALVSPVLLGDRAIGALQLHRTDNAVPWSDDDKAILEAVVDQLAQTAENLRLFEETRGRAGRERTIREITDRLRTAPTIERLLEIATTELGRRFSAVHAELDLGISVEETENNGQS